MFKSKTPKEGVSETVETGSTHKIVDYDELLSAAGEFGCYQWRLFFATLLFYVFGAFSYFSQLFITEMPSNYWCWIPELQNLTDLERRSLAIPADATARYGYSQCEAYNANWTEVLSSGLKPNQTWPTQKCQYGWEFNRTEMPPLTIGIARAWVCERNSYQAIAQSIFFVGSIVGGVLIGWVADRFGRLPAAILSNIIGCMGGVATVFAYDIICFSVCRFLVGMSFDNCMMMIYLLVLEYVAPKYRTMMSNIPFALFFTLGLLLLPLLSLAIGDWKMFSLATSLPMLLSLGAPFILLESPRWLLSRDRVDATVNNVKVIAKANKKEIPEKLIKDFKRTVQNKETVMIPQGITEIFKRPILARNFIFMCMFYACCMTTFDVLVRFSGELGFDFFLTFSIVSLTEFPSILLLGFILDYTGRKWLSIAVFCICCVFCVLTAFVSEGLPSVLCAMVARFMVNMVCNASMLWAAEMLPTSVRGTGVSIVHISGYVGTVLSPFIVYTTTVKTWLPLLIIAVICIFSIFLALFMPETADKEMPQTIENAEDLARNAKFIEIPCLLKRKKITNGHVNNLFELQL